MKTRDGKDVEIPVRKGKANYGDATVAATDLSAGKGLIHEIDPVMVAD